MNLIFFLLVSFLSVAVLLTVAFWNKIKFEWLAQISRFIVLSLPFERIPSLDSPFGNLRISQVLVITGFWVMFVLFFKRDKKLLKIKLNKQVIWLWLFILASLPSWIFVTDFRRFIVTYVATLLVFGAFFLISNFVQDVWERLRELTIVMICVSLFGIFQVIGDQIGLPVWITGLRELYTKDVFGIARIHATALEPLYFAGMMYLPIFFTLAVILTRKTILKRHFYYANFLILILFSSVFVLTLSKGAYLAILLPLALFLYFAYIKFNLVKILKSISWLATGMVAFVGIVALYSQRIFEIIQGYIIHIISTFQFQDATSVQRLIFVTTAWELLQKQFLLGIGSGQFGTAGHNLLLILTTETRTLIVNNVYLEIWLEFGFVPLFIFLLFILLPVFFGLKNLLFNNTSNKNSSLAYLVLICSLLAYYIQWFFFSPIFIMPIFILGGLLANLAPNYTLSED